MDNNHVICYCGKITAGMIQDAVNRGASTVEEVTDATGAGAYCGGCKNRIAKLIRELKEQPNNTNT